MFCPKCGNPNDDAARFCAKCGGALAAPAGAPPGGPTSPPVQPGVVRTAQTAAGRIAVGKNPTVALVLSIFLGSLGAGQFYNGDWKKGLAIAALSLLLAVPTAGLSWLGAWIWSMIDSYKVAKGEWSLW